MIKRRELGQLAGMTLAAVSLGGCTSPHASAPSSADAHTSFASLKQIDAGLLNIGYAEDGPPEGKPVILLHGWPYDIHSYVDVAPALAKPDRPVLWRRPAALETQATKAELTVERASRPHQRDIGRTLCRRWHGDTTDITEQR